MPIGIDHHKACIHDLKAAAKAWGYMSDGVKECIKYHEEKIKEMKKLKQAKAKLKELEMYLGMNNYRRASMFPGPGIDEEEARLTKEIKKLKKEYNL